MGKVVTVVLPSGKAVPVDESEVASLIGAGARLQTDEEGGKAAAHTVSEKETANEGPVARAEGLADTLTGGLYGRVANAMPGNYGARFRQRGQNENTSFDRGVGSVVGLLSPVGAADAAVGAGARIGESLGSKAVGYVAEGAMFGAQGAVQQANVTGDQLTVEGLTEGMGIGAIINTAVGSAADKVLGAFTKKAAGKAGEETSLAFKEAISPNSTPLGKAAEAQAKLNAAKEAKATTAAATAAKADTLAARKAFDDSAEYGGFKDAYESGTKAARDAHKASTKATERANAEIGSTNKELKSNWQQQTKDVAARNQKAIDDFTAANSAADKENAQALKDWAAGKAAVDSTNSKAIDEFAAANSAADKANAVDRSAYNKAAKPVQTEVEAFAGFATPKGVESTMKRFEQVQNTLRARIKKQVATLGDQEMAHAFSANKYIDSLKGSWKKAVADDSYEELRTAFESVNGKIKEAFPDFPDKALPRIPKYPGELPRAPIPRTYGELPEALPYAEPPVPKAYGELPDPAEGALEPNYVKPIEGPGELAAHAKLPDTLPEFGKLRSDSIARIAESLDPAGEAALTKLAEAIGIDATGTAEQTLHGIRQTMKDFNSADKLADRELPEFGDLVDGKWTDTQSLADRRSAFEEAQTEINLKRAQSGREEWAPGNLDITQEGGGRGAASKGGDGLLDKMVDWSKYGVKTSASRLVDVGGWKGAIARAMVGGAAGYVLDGIDGAMFGSAAIMAKGSLMGKISALIERGVPTARTAGRYGSYLVNRFDGSRDKDADEVDLAHKRMDEIYSVQQHLPDAMYHMVKPLMGQSGDVAYKMYAQVKQGIDYLAQMAPKDPGIDRNLDGSSNWRMSDMQAYQLDHRYHAIMNPLSYAARVMQGNGDPAGVEALGVGSPALLSEIRTAAAMKDWRDLTSEQLNGLSMLMGQPLTAAQHPDVLAVLQGSFLTGRLQPPQQGSSGGQQKPKQPPGRPAAVQSQVAGSNVSGLISQ